MEGNVIRVTPASKNKEIRCCKRLFFFFFRVQKAAGNACPRTMQDELGAMGAGWSGTFYCTHGGDRQKHIKDLRECQST